MSKILFTSDNGIKSMAYDAIGQRWGLGTRKGSIMILNTQFGIMRSWKGHRHGVSGLVFPSDGGLVSGSYDESVKRWDLETGRADDPPTVVWARNLGGGCVYALAELPGGRVAAGCEDSTVRVLDLGTGQEILVCRGHTSWVFAVISLGDLSAGTKVYTTFASGSGDGTIRVWTTSPIGGASEAEGGITPGRVVEVGSGVRSLSLSPCGGMVAAGCYDWSVRLFRLPEVTSGQPQGWDTVWSVRVHTNWVRSLSFSPDGRFLASGSEDKTIKILCSKTGIVLRTFEGHTSFVSSVFFSRNGTKIISASFDGTVRVWRLDPDLDAQMTSLIHGNQGSAFKKLYERLQKHYF